MPHLMGSDMDILFPVAVAAGHAGDGDFAPEPCDLEVRGQEIIGYTAKATKQKPLGTNRVSDGRLDVK